MYEVTRINSEKIIFFDKKPDWIIGKMVNCNDVKNKATQNKKAKTISPLINQTTIKHGIKNKSCVLNDNANAFFENDLLLLLDG